MPCVERRGLILTSVHMQLHMLMRDAEGRKKQARSSKQQAVQLTHTAHHCSSVVGGCDGVEPLLPCCVPEGEIERWRGEREKEGERERWRGREIERWRGREREGGRKRDGEGERDRKMEGERD